MTQLNSDTLQEFVLADATLRGLHWHADEPHLVLDLVLGSGKAATLTCTWARDVRIELNPSGAPLSRECTWERIEDCWLMQLDFGSCGCIRLECSDVFLE